MSGSIFYALVFDANGFGIGSNAYYGGPPAQLQVNEFACTQAQAQNPSAWQVTNGKLVTVPPTLVQQAQAMMSAGIQIVCTSNAALSGTYACDQASLIRVIGMMAAITANLSSVPATIMWPDVNGAPHPFTPTTFPELAGAILSFELELAPLIAGAPGTLPAQPVTIP